MISEKLNRAIGFLALERDFQHFAKLLVDQSADFSRSDKACLYIDPNIDNANSAMKLVYNRGVVPSHWPKDSFLVNFLKDSGESIVVTENKTSPFLDILLSEEMNSGIVLPLITDQYITALLFLNSNKSMNYGTDKLHFLESLTQMTCFLLSHGHFE